MVLAKTHMAILVKDMYAFIKARRACGEHVYANAMVKHKPRKLITLCIWGKDLFSKEVVQEVIAKAATENRNLLQKWGMSSKRKSSSDASPLPKNRKTKKPRVSHRPAQHPTVTMTTVPQMVALPQTTFQMVPQQLVARSPVFNPGFESCPRFKQRYSFIVPPVNDLYAILDSLKVSDTVLLIWPGDEELGDAGELLLSCILAQGLPSAVHVLSSLEELSQKDSTSSQDEPMNADGLGEELSNRLVLGQQSSHKKVHKRHRVRQNVLKEIEVKFPGPVRLHSLDRDQDSMLVLRQIGSQKQRPIFFRDNRMHIMAEKMEFVGEGSTGVLKVHGYVRGKPLSANSLIHIPGWGEYQMSQIDMTGDPHPLESGKSTKGMDDCETHLFEEADPELQETLISTNEIDPMEGEQTWPTEEELRDAEHRMEENTRKKLVPKGTSAYQAAWILDDEGDSNGEKSGDEGSCEDNEEEDPKEDYMVPVDVASQDGNEYEEDEDDEYESMSVTDAGDYNYDEKVDYKAEQDAFEKMQAVKDDMNFPDEVDTPMDTPARVRFQKFRGLQSFRTSSWDYNENLPVDYSRIFQFRNFMHTKKRILKEENEGALPGWYVVVHIKDVPRHLYDSQVTSQSPLVVFGILPHEQKMSVVNLVIKSHPSGHYRAIKSKERLIFHLGFRRFANQPIFSEHSTGNKHKFSRFFHPGTTVVATMFAPITFPPVSVLVFRERPDGAQDLVGTGSLLSVDPKRMVIKRAVLSGHPFKVNRKTAVVRFMFFNREDVMWFKPVELRTKWGRRGHIKEPLGTHGHMKCHFDGKLKSQDTVLLNLYKRMFPKWTFDPYVPRPPPLYTFRSSEDVDDRLSDEDSNVESLPRKKAKTVNFWS
ncbi:pre-rRNA-processing protein TSR1 homolog [Palaemon carinicauda]|uniref:pre-rRNA-processing protein TSR1 homolog n=1 Tax=Palaemon carinicauda TaxID=392227 RepID=UPI0035B603B1